MNLERIGTELAIHDDGGEITPPDSEKAEKRDRRCEQEIMPDL